MLNNPNQLTAKYPSPQKVDAMQDGFKIYDERPVSLQRRPIDLIYHDGQYDRMETRLMGPPLFVDRIVVCGYESSTGTSFYQVRNPISFKGLAKTARALSFNVALRTCSTIRSQNPILDLRDVEPNNVGHIMHTIVPACLHVRETVGPDVQFLFRPIKPAFRKFLDVFHIDPLTTRKSIQGMVLKVLAVRGYSTQNAIHLPDCPPITLFPNVFGNYKFSSGVESTKKVFIARRGARALLNHNEVTEQLESLGYKTIFMEDYATETQLGIAAEATDIVAVHGASLACLVVNPRINSLIELIPNHAYHEYFPAAFGNRVNQHIQIIPHLDQRIAFSDWDTIVHHKNAPFSVSLDQLSRAFVLVQREME